MTVLVRDRYEPIEVVGQGGEGRVLKAIDRQHERLVALKVRAVHGDVERERLLHEARLLLSVEPHPNLPVVREDFFDGDQYVIAMDWIEGTDLSKLLRARGRPGLAPSSVLPWLADAASALTHLHGQHPGVVHGDVKPANLVLTTGGRVVLVDFGWSSVPGAPRRRGGTPGYAAPELAAGEGASRATDVYSLAATAFALMTGAAPCGIRPEWEGIDPAAAEQLEASLRRGLATDPARRPASAGELVEHLRAGWGSTLPAGELTFCLTEIEGATALWESDPAGMARALVRHDELVADVVEAHRGRCVGSMGAGEATMSVFPAAVDAVAAAVALQQRLTAATGAIEAEPRMRVRVALHSGEAELRGGGYAGVTVKVAAELRGLADGGQIVLSGRTASFVAGALGADTTLVDLGPHRVLGQPTEPVYALSAPGVHAPPAATVCPYPGLPAFEREDADHFFGREAVVDGLVQRLRSQSFVALVGASGSGKSSVLRAGLAAAWGDATVMTPGFVPEPVPDGPELVVIDQLEEVFTLCDDADRRSALLDSVVGRTGPVAVGLRADFYGRCAEHAAFARAMASSQILLGPMSDDELRAAITGPAAMAGLRLEPALVDVLVADVGGEPGALPLLSHALRATWERRAGRTLNLEAYRSTGGVRAAIATTAEQVYGSFDPSEQELARRTFLALADPGVGMEDSRRRASRAELTPAGGDARLAEVLDAMATARLVSVDDQSVEVAHEALLREWPRLRAWLDEDRDGRRLQRHLMAAAGGWEALDRDPAELYRGPRLAAALEWAERVDPGEVPPLAAEFLAASVAEQERDQRAQVRSNRRLRGLLTGVGLALVAALVAGGLAIRRQHEASRSRDLADIARVAAVSRGLVDRQPDVGLLLAAAAFDLADTADTRGTLLQAVETHPMLEGLIYGAESGLEAAVFSPDGTVLATPTSDGTGTILWDTATRQRVDVLRHEDDISLGAAISPDGRWLAVPAIYLAGGGRPAGRLQVWDLTTRTLHTIADSPAGTLSTAAFSADGARLFTQGGPAGDRPPKDEVVVWDTRSWTPEAVWPLHDEYSGDRTFAVSGDGAVAALPLPDGAVARFRTADRTPLGSPLDVSSLTDDDVGPIRGVALGTDGRTLAVATEEGGVFLVDAATTALARHIDIPESAVSALELSPDGAVLAAGRLDGRTQLYDVASGDPLGPPLAASAAAITDVSFDADGTRLVTTGLDRTGAFWRLDGARSIGLPLAGHEAAVTEAAFTNDGSRIVTGALDGDVVVRDGRTGAVMTKIPTGGEVLSVDVDRTRPRLAAGGTEEVTLADLDGRSRRSVDVGGWANEVAFAPDGGMLAVAVDSSEGSPDAAGPGAGEVHFVDPDTGTVAAPAIELTEPPIGVAYSPDGRSLGVVTGNNLLHLYSVADGREAGPPIENPDSQITSLAFSPDGTRVAVGLASGAVRQYDVATHEPAGELLEGDPDGVFGVAYSPDGTLLAATTLGFSTTELWDARSGAPLGTRLTGGRVPYSFQTFLVEHVMGSRPAFSPSGRALATPGFPGASVLWNLEPSAWRAAACSIAGRQLTDEEWDRYLPGRRHRPLCTES
jgi:WD40 repeat protein/tRNA A-37 threonylcarbamoyl transferase component Bud32